MINFLNALGASIFPDSLSCHRNIIKKHFLFFKWKKRGQHHLKINSIEKWGATHWRKYQIEAECIHCATRFHEFGLDESDLIKIGISKQKIRKIK